MYEKIMNAYDQYNFFTCGQVFTSRYNTAVFSKNQKYTSINPWSNCYDIFVSEMKDGR